MQLRIMPIVVNPQGEYDFENYNEIFCVEIHNFVKQNKEAENDKDTIYY